MHDPRLAKLAHVLVHYSLAVRPGQLVRVASSPLAEPLLIELQRAFTDAGAHVIWRLSLESLDEVRLKHATEQQLQFANPIDQLEYERIDCYLGIWAEQNTRGLSNVDPRRIALAESARKPLLETMMKRAASGALRWAGTQYPTLGCAQEAEMSLGEYEHFVFSAGLLDTPDPVAAWKRVSERQQRLVDFLDGKHELRVVAANGTDLRMNVAGRKWINCDGHENFPDGEVFTGPVLESVEGEVRFSFPAVHNGREVQDVALRFREGKVVEASAAKNESFLFSMLEMDAGSRMLGECAIGTNYGITRYTRNTLFDEKIGGTVHFALGAGYPETGNTNESGLHWDMVVDLRSGGRVEIDGEVISENGRFTRPDWPSPG
jgi:aminopeptidase